MIVSLHVNASDPDGIKLNNDAVELLGEALKSRKKGSTSGVEGLRKESEQAEKRIDRDLEKLEEFQEQSTFKKIMQLFFSGAPKLEGSGDDPDVDPESEEQETAQSGDFLPGQDKKDKDDDGENVDEDMVHDAHKKFMQATIKSGELSEIRMNLGLSFELSGDKENSFKAYNMAEKVAKGRPNLEFIARYNKARLLAEQKKIPLALSEYQSALEINPESVEVKVNIELLMQQQQGGGGGGDGEKKDKNDEGKGSDPDAPLKKSPKNSEYKSENLSKKDVKKILEELKNQEQKIREKEYNKGVKEKSRDKDW